MKRLVLVTLLVTLTLSLALPVRAANGSKCDMYIVHWSLELKPGYWSLGAHQYDVRYEGPKDYLPAEFPASFEVTADAPLYSGQVLLRFLRLVASDGSTPTVINVSQDTVFQSGWLVPAETPREAEQELEGMRVLVRWDGGDWVQMKKSPAMQACDSPFMFHRVWGKAY